MVIYLPAAIDRFGTYWYKFYYKGINSITKMPRMSRLSVIPTPKDVWAQMLDETNLKIIELLSRDGRMPMTQIGSELGISHVTARNRLEQMISRGILEVRGYVDPSVVGLTTEVVIGLKGDLSEVSALVKKLASLTEVTFAAIVTGRYDIMIAVSVESGEKLLDFIQGKLSKLPGIREVEIFHILLFEKRRVQWRVPKLTRNGNAARPSNQLPTMTNERSRKPRIRRGDGRSR